MLTTISLTLQPEKNCLPKAEWGYRLYAALLEQASQAFAQEVHQNHPTTVSQFLDCRLHQPVWTVSLLGENSELQISALLENLDHLDLNKEQLRMQVVHRSICRIPDVETLLNIAEHAPQYRTLYIRTPAAFKSQGTYINLPTPRLVVQNLLRKWNSCIQECPIDDPDGEGMEAIISGLRFSQFQLQSQTFFLKGRPISGFTGCLTIENKLTGFHRQLAEALLLFSSYSGLGIKTALGMGGITLSLASKS